MNKYVIGFVAFIAIIGYALYNAEPSDLGKRISQGIKTVKTKQQCENEIEAWAQSAGKAAVRQDVCAFINKPANCEIGENILAVAQAWFEHKVDQCMKDKIGNH